MEFWWLFFQFDGSCSNSSAHHRFACRFFSSSDWHIGSDDNVAETEIQPKPGIDDEAFKKDMVNLPKIFEDLVMDLLMFHFWRGEPQLKRRWSSGRAAPFDLLMMLWVVFVVVHIYKHIYIEKYIYIYIYRNIFICIHYIFLNDNIYIYI